jgi:hypothetical protein
MSDSIRQFSPQDVARMRHEMLTQFAPATPMPDAVKRAKPLNMSDADSDDDTDADGMQASEG